MERKAFSECSMRSWPIYLIWIRLSPRGRPGDVHYSPIGRLSRYELGRSAVSGDSPAPLSAGFVVVGSAEARASRNGRRRAPRKRRHAARIDVASDQIGFPDSDICEPTWNVLHNTPWFMS